MRYLYENGNLGNVGSEVFTQEVWNVWFSLLVSVWKKLNCKRQDYKPQGIADCSSGIY